MDEYICDGRGAHRKMTTTARTVVLGGIPAVLRLGEGVLGSAAVTAMSVLPSVVDLVAPNGGGGEFSSSGSGGGPTTIPGVLVHHF